MEICMLSDLFHPFMLGGAERRYFEIARRLAKRHNVTVYSLNFRGRQENNVEGIKVVRVGARHPLDRRSLPHLATYWPAFLKAFSGKYDVIDANQGISSFSGVLKLFSRKPVVATFHDIYWDAWGEYFPFPSSSIGKGMEFAWSKLPYSRIITVSGNTEKKLRLLDFKPDVSVVPSGVDTNHIDRIKSEKKDLTVLFVGRLVAYKKVDELLHAFRKVQDEYPRARLEIIGQGPLEGELKKLAVNLKLNAEFRGFISEDDKIRAMKSATMLVNPSTVEGLGLILIESMACGTPVVARRLDTYFFCNPQNSYLYTDNLAGTMLEVIGNNTRRKNVTRAGIETAGKFSWDNVASQVEKIYRDVA